MPYSSISDEIEEQKNSSPVLPGRAAALGNAHLSSSFRQNSVDYSTHTDRDISISTEKKMQARVLQVTGGSLRRFKVSMASIS